MTGRQVKGLRGFIAEPHAVPPLGEIGLPAAQQPHLKDSDGDQQ